MSDLVTLATPMADRVLCWSAETILVGSALAAVAALACRASGRRPALGPAARHTLWLVVLIKLMAPPLVHWPWSVPIASARAAAPPTRLGTSRPGSSSCAAAPARRGHGASKPA